MGIPTLQARGMPLLTADNLHSNSLGKGAWPRVSPMSSPKPEGTHMASSSSSLYCTSSQHWLALNAQLFRDNRTDLNTSSGSQERNPLGLPSRPPGPGFSLLPPFANHSGFRPDGQATSSGNRITSIGEFTGVARFSQDTAAPWGQISPLATQESQQWRGRRRGLGSPRPSPWAAATGLPKPWNPHSHTLGG